jgi:DNA-binding PadR family transcriptional regulator
MRNEMGMCRYGGGGLRYRETGGGGHHGHRSGRRSGGGRVLAGSELRLLLLSLIGREARHGYDLIRAIEERSGGHYAPSPGVVYPALAMLEDMGLIEKGEPDGARKSFAVTAAGEAELADKATELGAIEGRLSSLSQRERGRDAAIARAMDNLKMVLGNIPADAKTEAANEIAAIIDEAARTIERSR